jgi:hypothetical protein
MNIEHITLGGSKRVFFYLGFTYCAVQAVWDASYYRVQADTANWCSAA